MFGFLKKRKEELDTASQRVFDGKMSFAMTEAYNFLRASLKFAAPNKKSGKIIGITSACPHDGKSYTSLNLAFSLAKNGHSVLLIDADMRKSNFAAVLNLPMSPGLSNVLSGETEFEKATHFSVITKNLDVLLAGDFPPNPAELVESDGVKLLFDSNADKYEYIIVDLPPVMSVADSLLISKYIDGTIVVLRHGQSRKKNIQYTVRQLKLSGVHIIGFVYNKYSTASSRREMEYKHYGNYDENNHYYKNKKSAEAADLKK